MNTEESIKSYLNSLGQVPGAVLYRGTYNWKGLAPGNQGDILAIGPDSRPYWSEIGYYTPAMMDFSNASSYYTRAITTAGKQYTLVGAFAMVPRAGSSHRYLVSVHGGSSVNRRLGLYVGDTSHAANGDKIVFHAFDTAGATLFFYKTPAVYLDGDIHTFFWSYDANTGNHLLQIDGVTITTAASFSGNLRAGGQTFEVGRVGWFGGTDYNGQLGYLGYHDTLLATPGVFFSQVNTPLKPDESSWSQWGSQPKVWNENADVIKNYGSIGNFARNGTPFVGKGWIL